MSSNKARGYCCRTSCRTSSPIAAEACSPAVFACTGMSVHREPTPGGPGSGWRRGHRRSLGQLALPGPTPAKKRHTREAHRASHPHRAKTDWTKAGSRVPPGVNRTEDPLVCWPAHEGARVLRLSVSSARNVLSRARPRFPLFVSYAKPQSQNMTGADASCVPSDLFIPLTIFFCILCAV